MASPLPDSTKTLRITVHDLMTSEQRAPLEAALRGCQAEGRSFSLLLVGGGDRLPCEMMPRRAIAVGVAPGLSIVGLPSVHIDGACALAESLVRRPSLADGTHIGVAQLMPMCPDLESMLERAEEALRMADGGGVGPVVSMHWADVSRDLQLAWSDV
ncbi:MAG: hypothetical protein ACFB9M_19090 [Myxococcota bacterium]